MDYTLTQKGEPEKGTAISRKSIAAFIATLVENPHLYDNIQKNKLEKTNEMLQKLTEGVNILHVKLSTAETNELKKKPL